MRVLFKPNLIQPNSEGAMLMKNSTNKRKLLSTLTSSAVLGLSAVLVLSVASTLVLAAEMSNEMNADMSSAPATYSNDWKTPNAIEFDRLDTTGNGLLLPYEASKGKAFTKKTFALADANKDGYIDVDEFVHHKTGQWPEVAQSANMAASDNVGGSALVSEEPEMMADNQTSADNDASDNANKRSVGMVIDDSVITTKAKAKILATKDLKTLQISVETRQGEITLSGAVDNEAAKMKAEQVVSEIEGVESVNNALEVKN